MSWIEHFKENHGATVFKFYEDNFAVSRKRLKAFCNLLIDRKLSIAWECESRGDLTEEEISLMADSGCHAVGIGVESGSPRMLEFLRKDIDLEDVERLCRLLAKHRIGPGIYVMAGLPTETGEELDMTVGLLDRLDFKWCEYMIYRPYPGTVLYDYCVSNNLFDPPQRLADWVHFSDLYDSSNALASIPKETLERNLSIFRKRYVLNPLKFMIRHDTKRLLILLLNPVKVLGGARRLALRYLALLRYLKGPGA